MMKRLGSIFAFFALLTLVSMPLTPALASFFAKAGQVIEICTTQGIKTIIFDENGVSHEQERPHDTAGHCPYCLGRFTALSLPSAILLPIPDFTFNSFDFENSEILAFHTGLYAQYRPRDPPTLSA